MQNIPVTIAKTTLPTVKTAYDSFDILGKTVGRYFDYKQNTKLIEHETEKVREQAKVMVKKIDAELTQSLDMNAKNFRKEMKRLQVISKELKSDAKSRSDILNNIKAYTKMLSDNTLEKEVKLMIPQMIRDAHDDLKALNGQSIEKLNLMTGVNSKSIGEA